MEQAVVVAEVAPQVAATAAVEIAQINADRDVAIAAEQTAQAAAHTGAIVAVAEVEAETDDEEVIWLKAELASLRVQCETNAGALSALQQVTQAQGQQIAELTGLLSSLTAPLIPPQLSANPNPAEPGARAAIEPEALPGVGVVPEAMTIRRRKFVAL